MRTLKFRAWDKINKGMVDVHQINWELGIITISHGSSWHNHIENYVVLQYTGLEDKNGKEICEGDIVAWFSGSPAIVTFGTIIYGDCDEGGTGWICEDCFLDSRCVVLGNIYENPELLK